MKTARNMSVLYKQNKYGFVFDLSFNKIEPNTEDYTSFKEYLSNGGTIGETTYISSDNEYHKDFYRNQVDSIVEFLNDNALAYSMNKYGKSQKVLSFLRESYENKYKVSKLEVTSGVIYDTVLDTLQKEMKDELTEPVIESILQSYGVTPEGDHLNKMFQLVIFKYEYGESVYFKIKALAEHFRTKIDKYIKSGDWIRTDKLIEFMTNLINSFDSSKIGEYRTNLDTIDLS